MMRALFLALACLALTGCASLDPYAQPPVAQRLPRADALGECARVFRASDTVIDAAGTRDAQAPRVPGFPYLRVDRTLVALAAATEAKPADAQAWTAALAALDDTARRLELRNAGRADETLAATLAACRRLLAAADQQELRSLLDAAQVPDEYSTTMRALGLYPLTRHAFAAGIRRWQRDTLAEFAADAEAAAERPAVHPRRRYVAGRQPDAVPTLRQLPELGLPLLTPTALASLVARHAPAFAIETASDDDRPGALVWQREPGRLLIGVAVDQPVLYVRTGHAWLGGRWLLQLTYSAWFAARPPTQPYDLLAGRLDGLLWRVTLGEDGTPLVYDTIHPCGCYHLFIPTERVRARPQPETVDEGLFVPQTLRSPVASERLVLKVAAGTHYLQQVEIETAASDDGIALALRDDDQLRSLPLPDGGTRSAFGPDGLIAASERLERVYFWPMGITSAGQMRQWGRHATAFVGRRHFDDPTLFDRYFERLP